jgi:hypothetical protein
MSIPHNCFGNPCPICRPVVYLDEGVGGPSVAQIVKSEKVIDCNLSRGPEMPTDDEVRLALRWFPKAARFSGAMKDALTEFVVTRDAKSKLHDFLVPHDKSVPLVVVEHPADSRGGST